jgi:hypothetical protein
MATEKPNEQPKRRTKKEIKGALEKLKGKDDSGSPSFKPQVGGKVHNTDKKSSQRIRKQGV